MASYNDYYDSYDARARARSRSRPPSRRYDDPPSARSRVRGEEYLSPTLPRRANRYSYDDRFSHPSSRPRSPDLAGRSRSSAPQRRSWPPPPTVENEATALAKEASPTVSVNELTIEEAPAKGAIDQEPIIQDAPGYSTDPERPTPAESDVGKEAPSAASIPTPPTSDDEETRRGRSKRSPDQDGEEDVVAPQFQRRAPSTYAYTRPEKNKTDVPSSDNFLSPDANAPPRARSRTRRQSTRFADDRDRASSRKDSVRLSPRSRKEREYYGLSSADEHAIADDFSDPPPSVNLNRRRSKSSRRPNRRPSESPATSTLDFAQRSEDAPRPRRGMLESRRQTDTAASLPRLRAFDKSIRPSPLMTASALSDVGQSSTHLSPDQPKSASLSPFDTSPHSSKRDSRNVSPASATSRTSASSATHAGAKAPDLPRESSGSQPSSGPPSASGSRPGTPTSSNGAPSKLSQSSSMPQNDLDWSGLMAATGRPRTASTRQPSRLSTSMRMDSAPEVPRYNSAGPRPSSTVHYPVDLPYSASPSDRAYPSLPPRPAPLDLAFQQDSMGYPRSGSPAVGPQDRLGARPGLPTRHTFSPNSPVDSRPPTSPRFQRPETPRKISLNGVPPTKAEVEEILAKGMPGCPRPEPAAGYDDWYTLIGCPTLDFCPYCIEDVFERTIYRSGFRRSLPRALNTKVQCAFSTPWIRLAWILTLQQRKPDLTLMRDLADIEQTSDACPGGLSSLRAWYGIRDPQGLYVRDFHICYTDVRKIERLLPTLNGLFVRLPNRASLDKRRCALRADGNRFSLYLDHILAMHDRALARRQLPDPMPFIDAVERKARVRECERDNMLLGALWHFHPSVPEFTVCEDCYEEIVEPEIKNNGGKDSSGNLAGRFNRTLQPAYGEGLGTSCQLYSRRMRKVFRTACRENDVKYLGKKARERREAELRLQERYREVLKRARRMGVVGDAGGEGEEEKRLERELEKISGEWKEVWE